MPQSNRVICRNEVIIEGVNVGQFETFSMRANYKSFGATATLTIPLYGVGITQLDNATQHPTKSAGRANARMLTKFKDVIIDTCAEVEVYCWYEGYEKIRVFKGFVEHVAEGFPVTLYLRDSSFITRFGTVQVAWDGSATLQKIVNDCLPIANKGFQDERKRRGFTRAIPDLKYSEGENNVQATTTPLSLKDFAVGRAPYEVITYLMQQVVLYAGVTDQYGLYIGAGVEKSIRPVIRLATDVNVVGREIVPANGLFVDYDVKVVGILKNGKKYTATGGLTTSKSPSTKDDFNRKFGESHRFFCPLNTVKEIQAMADRQLAALKGERNKGTITLLLYPKCQLLDHVIFDDTVFDIYDSLYYVLGYSFSASDKGYFQRLEVTDRVFSL